MSSSSAALQSSLSFSDDDFKRLSSGSSSSSSMINSRGLGRSRRRWVEPKEAKEKKEKEEKEEEEEELKEEKQRLERKAIVAASTSSSTSSSTSASTSSSSSENMPVSLSYRCFPSVSDFQCEPCLIQDPSDQKKWKLRPLCGISKENKYASMEACQAFAQNPWIFDLDVFHRWNQFSFASYVQALKIQRDSKEDEKTKKNKRREWMLEFREFLLSDWVTGMKSMEDEKIYTLADRQNWLNEWCNSFSIKTRQYSSFLFRYLPQQPYRAYPSFLEKWTYLMLMVSLELLDVETSFELFKQFHHIQEQYDPFPFSRYRIYHLCPVLDPWFYPSSWLTLLLIQKDYSSLKYLFPSIHPYSHLTFPKYAPEITYDTYDTYLRQRQLSQPTGVPLPIEYQLYEEYKVMKREERKAKEIRDTKNTEIYTEMFRVLNSRDTSPKYMERLPWSGQLDWFPLFNKSETSERDFLNFITEYNKLSIESKESKTLIDESIWHWFTLLWHPWINHNLYNKQDQEIISTAFQRLASWITPKQNMWDLFPYLSWIRSFNMSFTIPGTTIKTDDKWVQLRIKEYKGMKYDQKISSEFLTSIPLSVLRLLLTCPLERLTSILFQYIKYKEPGEIKNKKDELESFADHIHQFITTDPQYKYRFLPFGFVYDIPTKRFVKDPRLMDRGQESVWQEFQFL